MPAEGRHSGAACSPHLSWEAQVPPRVEDGMPAKCGSLSIGPFAAPRSIPEIAKRSCRGKLVSGYRTQRENVCQEGKKVRPVGRSQVEGPRTSEPLHCEVRHTGDGGDSDVADPMFGDGSWDARLARTGRETGWRDPTCCRHGTVTATTSSAPSPTSEAPILWAEASCACVAVRRIGGVGPRACLKGCRG